MRQRRVPGPMTGPLAEEASDLDLVARALRRDGAAFEAIMRRNNRRLYRVARGILRSDHEAEDVVQETYVRAFAKLADFKGPHGLSAWLARIAANEALGRLRRRGQVVLIEDFLKDSGAGSSGAPRGEPGVGLGVGKAIYEGSPAMMDTRMPNPERQAESAELRRLIESAIDELPDGFRAVFMLRAVEQMSIAETATLLDIRPETVKTRFHRARALMRKTMESRVTGAAEAAFPFAGARCDRIVAKVLARLELRPGA